MGAEKDADGKDSGEGVKAAEEEIVLVEKACESGHAMPPGAGSWPAVGGTLAESDAEGGWMLGGAGGRGFRGDSSQETGRLGEVEKHAGSKLWFGHRRLLRHGAKVPGAAVRKRGLGGDERGAES